MVEDRDLESIQLGVFKGILRLNKSTTDEFVRGEVGALELKRERHKAMLVWLGRVLGMGKERWPRRVFDMKWEVRTRVGVKSWRQVVDKLIQEYSLGSEVEELEKGELVQSKWEELVKEAVERVDLESWEDGRLAGKKMGLYREVKETWGFEQHLEGKYGKGEILMTRFRSGSAAIGEEMARWKVREGEEDKWEGGWCKTCDGGQVETLRHVLLECEAFSKEREEWRRRVEEVVREVTGWVDTDPMKLMLGWRGPDVGFKENAIMTCSSSWFFETLWKARTTMIHDPRVTSCGVKDLKNHGNN